MEITERGVDRSHLAFVQSRYRTRSSRLVHEEHRVKRVWKWSLLFSAYRAGRELPGRKAMPDEDVQEVEATWVADLGTIQQRSVHCRNIDPPWK